jgi:hypothetical protein
MDSQTKDSIINLLSQSRFDGYKITHITYEGRITDSEEFTLQVGGLRYGLTLPADWEFPKTEKKRRESNPCNKEVKREEAHEVWQTLNGEWTWYVLKKWQSPTNEAKNPFARWYCNVVSPMVGERGETGDVYVADIKSVAVKLDYNPLVKEKKPEPSSKKIVSLATAPIRSKGNTSVIEVTL